MKNKSLVNVPLGNIGIEVGRLEKPQEELVN